jgi:putative membrane protein
MMTGLGFMGLFGGLLMVLFWVGLIGLPVWLVWTLVDKNRGAPQPKSGKFSTPREILDQRYARGEIDRDEYTQRKRDLG